MNFNENSDVCQLLIRCRKHDDEAFDELVHRYMPMIRSVVTSFSGVTADEDELFCEACVALHIAAQKYVIDQDEVSFGLYARICIRNRIVDLLRRTEHGRVVSEFDVEQLAEEDSLETRVADRETFDLILDRAHCVLSDYEYHVLLLHIQGYKTSAIASALEKTAKSVDNAKNRLFRKLRQEIGDISI